MHDVPTKEQKLMEYSADIAAVGASAELAKAIGVAEHELTRLLGTVATRDLVERARAELAYLLAHRVFLMVPKSFDKLDEKVDDGNIRAIENVLDRAGFPRATRSNVSIRHPDTDAGADFGKYVEQAGGDLDQVEKGLEQMKADAVEGEWTEETGKEGA